MITYLARACQAFCAHIHKKVSKYLLLCIKVSKIDTVGGKFSLFLRDARGAHAPSDGRDATLLLKSSEKPLPSPF